MKRLLIAASGCAGISVICLLAACSSADEAPESHPAYFDPVFQRAYAFGSEGVLEGFAVIDSAYAAFPEASPLDLTRKYNHKLEYYWSLRKDHYKGRLYTDSILRALSGHSGHPAYAIEYGKALLTRGDILQEEGRYSDAFARYYEGRALILKAGDTCFFNEFSGRLAMTYYRQNRFREAIPYFREAFTALESCASDPFYRFRIQQAVLDNIGLAYHHMERGDSAMFYYDSTLRYLGAHGGVFLHNPQQAAFIGEANAVVQGNKGSLLLQQGDTLGAERLYAESIATNLHGGNETRDAQITITKLAALQLVQQRYAEADHWLAILRHSLDSLPQGEPEMLWHKLRSDYFLATGNPAQAFHYLRGYIRVKDSMATAVSPLRDIDIQKEFSYLTREYELGLLKRKNEIKTMYLYLAVIFFIMTIVIILLIWQNWKRSKKHIEELRRLNQQIMLQHDQMNKSLDALEQSQTDNSRMMKIAAHDLRNPLGAIITLADLVQLKEDGRPGETRQLLGMMKESGEKALQLINELLKLNVVTDTQMEAVQIDVVLQYCVDLLRLKAQEKGQQIELHTLSLTMQASREKIWRVFSNLITNAVKFSPRGAVIEVFMTREPHLARISVKDRGIGIPPHMKSKIFSMAPGAGRRGTEGEVSYGLGLAISRQIVESHNGRIWFESEEGKGSVFHVEFRIIPIEPAP